MPPSFGFAYDGPPSQCAKGPRPGTKALRDGVMRLFPGVTDVGIFNCRPTRNSGSTTLSFHADGRAWDAGCSGDLNEAVFQFLIANADTLGVQEVISKRRRWDSRTQKISHYGGDDPHTEHVHTSQCKRAADTLTLATVLSLRPGNHQEDDMYGPAERDELVIRLDRALTILDDLHMKASHQEIVLEGLDPDVIVNAIPDEIAEAVADKLAQRLKA